MRPRPPWPPRPQLPSLTAAGECLPRPLHVTRLHPSAGGWVVEQALKAANRDLLEHGGRGRYRQALRAAAEKLLPPDAHERCSRGGFHLAATAIKGPCPACWSGDELPAGEWGQQGAAC